MCNKWVMVGTTKVPCGHWSGKPHKRHHGRVSGLRPDGMITTTEITWSD